MLSSRYRCPLGVVMLALLSMTTETVSADTVLTYSPWLPPEHLLNRDAVNPWMEKVAEVTEGRVRVEPRAATVGSPREQFEVVRDGLADVSIIPLGYTPGRFPLVEIGELPLLHEDNKVLAPAFYRIYEKFLAQYQPFEGTHLLSVYSTAPTHFVTSTGIIDSLDDLEGLKLRVPNSTTSAMAKSLGAIPLQKSATEEYQLASAGIIDGTFAAPSTIVSFGTGEFLHYVTLVPGGVGQAVQVLLVNEDKWDTISDEDQVAIMAISGEQFARAAGTSYAEASEAALVELQEAGGSVAQLETKVVEQLAQKFDGVFEEWIANARQAGLRDPERVLEGFRAEIAAEVETEEPL